LPRFRTIGEIKLEISKYETLKWRVAKLIQEGGGVNGGMWGVEIFARHERLTLKELVATRRRRTAAHAIHQKGLRLSQTSWGTQKKKKKRPEKRKRSPAEGCVPKRSLEEQKSIEKVLRAAGRGSDFGTKEGKRRGGNKG